LIAKLALRYNRESQIALKILRFSSLNHVPILPGIIVGELIGGLLGGVIGHHMDEQNHAYMSQAITTTPMNETTSWTNTKTKTTYHVTPTKDYKAKNNQFFREYQTTVVIGNGKKLC